MESLFHHQSLERRQKLARNILEMYPDRVPVIVYPACNAPRMNRTKFLVPVDTEMVRFINSIRKHVAVNSDQALFVFVGDPSGGKSTVVPQPSATVEQVYQQHKQPDGFLYAHYTLENTFG